MSNSTLSMNSNVTIKYINEYNKITKIQRIHNKANIQMVEGLLRFMRGDFTPSEYNQSQYDNSDAPGYIPSEIRFGTVGVKLTNRIPEPGQEDKPRLDKIDYSELKIPTFDDYQLQEEIRMLNPLYIEQFDQQKIKFESTELAAFDDPNNSLALLLQVFIPSGQLVRMKNSPDPYVPVIDPQGNPNAQGYYEFFDNEYVLTGDTSVVPDKVYYKYFPFIYYTDSNVKVSPTDSATGEGWVFWNPSIGQLDSQDNPSGEYEAIFTEMGLYSSKGTLLARILFDGKIDVNHETGEIIFEDENYERNPVIQSESSSIIVEWRIGIVSIGQNDKIITLADVAKEGN